jgi:hypothetical protein
MKHVFNIEISYDEYDNRLLKILNKLEYIDIIEFDDVTKNITIEGSIKLDPVMEAIFKYSKMNNKVVSYLYTF